MPPKKGKKSGTLPRVDRSRALPVRTGIGFYKTVAIAACVAVVVYACDDSRSVSSVPETPTVVSPR